ncbi:MAG: hypothetical protein KDK39_19505 [Leptospiraceae bacterium]|nr:hypothetical protein [Leptospiraceae bacterium]
MTAPLRITVIGSSQANESMLAAALQVGRLIVVCVPCNALRGAWMHIGSRSTCICCYDS